MLSRSFLSAAVSLVSFAVTACGGGGGGGVAAIPPPPTPTPTAAAVTILANPVVGEFGSVGVATSGNRPVSDFGRLSTAQSDQVHIRYTSDGHYEIQMPGAAWEQLTFAKGVVPADPSTFNWFQPASAPQNGASLITQVARLQGYKYSEMGAWYNGADKFGEVAFGELTLASQMPVSGSASYHGLVSGTSDVVQSDAFDGSFNVPVDGSVNLNFDFGKGTLSGAMTLNLSGIAPIGTFSFTDTVFSAGSTSYSGKFDTSVAGDNFFLGQFTGPNAQETIGAWALPFLYGGDDHQAFGAWIAKQTP